MHGERNGWKGGYQYDQLVSAWREQWLEGWVTVGSVSECMERAMVGRVGNSRIS